MDTIKSDSIGLESSMRFKRIYGIGGIVQNRHMRREYAMTIVHAAAIKGIT